MQQRAALILAPDLSRPETPAVNARVERRGRAEMLGRVRLDAAGLSRLKHAAASHGRSVETMIELPAETMLEKRLVLPAPAERDLERVLAYEMDRETPFSADEVYWGSEIEHRDRAHRRITVRLAVVAKAQLAELSSLLVGAELPPAYLIGVAREGRRSVIPIDHDTARRRGMRDYALPAMAWACAVLAVAAVAVPFVQQSLAIDEVDQEIAALRPTVDAVEKLRERIEGDRQQAEALAAQRAQFGNPLAVLAAVTAALPDDSSLTELDYSMGKLILTGQSSAAAHLIGDLSSKPPFKDPTFTAPVTRVEAGKFDIFTISTQMSP